ncbi:MAG: hypothetical protein U0791_23430 [Gemmataceae bacterium]
MRSFPASGAFTMLKLRIEPELWSFQPSPVTPHPVAGRRFEAMFEPEWDQWAIIDRATGGLHRCEDQHSAEREADSLEAVAKLVRGVADHFTVA